jgi:aminoglycoside phosphotransferase (APT) family kinase protein
MPPSLSPADPLDLAAADVLRRCWGIAAVPDRVATGVSRDTWRIGGAFWLSHSHAADGTPFRREAELLRVLPAELARVGATWKSPEVVPSADGGSIAVSGGSVWRLTRHMVGEEPDPQDPGSYPALAKMLAEVHAVLRSLPQSLSVCERGTVERGREVVEVYTAPSFVPATQDARECFVVRAVAEWLAPRLGELEEQPRQLTHGDWIPRNLKVSPEGWGVLDWEYARSDPVVMDLAQSCCTLLIWSGLDRMAERIEDLVRHYSVQSGQGVSLGSVRAAMVLYWLHNYDYWRERQERTGRYEHVLARQPERLRSVGLFVGAL